MIIRAFSSFMNSSVKYFIVGVLASEGFAYDLEKDLDLNDIGTNYLENGGIFFVAFINNTIVGTCAVKKKSSDKCEIKRLYVHTDFRRMGVGSALLDKALKFATAHYKTATLKTAASLEPAITLYLKAGFSVIKEENGTVYLKAELS